MRGSECVGRLRLMGFGGLGSGFRVLGFGFSVLGLGFGVWGVGFRVEGGGSRRYLGVHGLGCLELRV